MRFSTASLAAVLLCASGLWIGEEAVDGRGLHLAALWALLAAMAAFRELSGVERSGGRSFGLADAAVFMVASGHVLSSWHIEQVGGDRRAAWNLTMEWFGLAAAWYTLRLVCRSGHDRTLITEALLTLTAGLAAQGIWQHHLTFPRQAMWYEERREALDSALRTPGSAALQTVQEITAEFGQQGIPLEGSSRILWENRLLHSTEPLGPFALTNTLAALLTAGLIPAVARWSSARGRLVHRVSFGLTIAAVGYCLVLTKSRSGWLAASCGLLVLAVHSGRQGWLRLILRGCLAAGGLAMVLVPSAICMGVIDREVILEAPKSLQYRLFYWIGSLEMLADQPLFGAGPGNFRQAYLPYKPDESSEEIRDPHNYILEAWSSAGLPGLAGILLLTFVTAAAFRRQAGEVTGAGTGELSQGADQLPESSNTSTVGQRPRTLSAAVPALCMAAGWLLDTAWEWLSADSLRDKSVDLLLLAGIPLVLVRRRLPELAGSRATLAAAGAVLLHLLASGGFSVSVVMLTVLACGAAGPGAADGCLPRAPNPPGLLSRRRIAVNGVIILLSPAAAAAIVLAGLIPLMTAERRLDKALLLAASSRTGNDSAAIAVRTAFRSAIAADPRRAGTCQVWAEYESGRLQASLQESASASYPDVTSESSAFSLLAGVEEACAAWIDSDPRGFAARQLRASARRRVWESSGDEELLRQALADLEESVRMHPGQAGIWLQKAELERAAGRADAAGSSAARAAELNQINHDWGHQDQFLSESEERRLRLLLPGQGRGDSLGRGRQEIRAAE